MLAKAALKAEIKQLMTDMRTRTENADDEFAERLSNAIDTYVKTAAIKYISGLVAPSGGGPVTGVFNGNLE
tara:strand:- start:2865 stop:3077 length:213 start_codon:yes stop_codon:yes gene_type:complete